jgi:hypothetical protein
MKGILSTYCKCTLSAVTCKLNVFGQVLIWIFWYVELVPKDCRHLSVTPFIAYKLSGAVSQLRLLFAECRLVFSVSHETLCAVKLIKSYSLQKFITTCFDQCSKHQILKLLGEETAAFYFLAYVVNIQGVPEVWFLLQKLTEGSL